MAWGILKNNNNKTTTITTTTKNKIKKKPNKQSAKTLRVVRTVKN